jgi:Trypsin-like peptidase domain
MLTAEWLRAFAPVGIFAGESNFSAYGACVFFHKPPCLWIVTANHVLHMIGELQRFSVLVAQEASGKPTVIELGKIQRSHSLGWIINEQDDLAVAIMPISPDLSIKAVVRENCLALGEVLPSMPSYTLGCPYGLIGMDELSTVPLVLNGVVSGVNKNNRKLYTSAPTFPGNSGGPLIVIRTPFTPKGSLTVGVATVFLAGIMLERVTTTASEGQGGLPSLHLGVARSTDAVLDLLDSPGAQDEAAKITAR